MPIKCHQMPTMKDLQVLSQEAHPQKIKSGEPTVYSVKMTPERTMFLSDAAT